MSDKDPELTQKPRRRGIYLLPNLFTTAALFSGFYAIIGAVKGHFDLAAMALFIAMILDTMDGRIARLTNTQSDFGAEYDSLADLISFGLAPALLMYQWSLFSLGKLGWLAAFIYTAATALRLARFNVQVETTDKAYFQGLPSPAAAALLAGFIWFAEESNWQGTDFVYFCLFITITAGLLMVSNIRYLSFKKLNLKNKVPFIAVLFVVLIFVLISINPAQVLFSLSALYVVSGIIITLYGIQKSRSQRKT